MGAVVCEGAPHDAVKLPPNCLAELTTIPSMLMLQVT
jgi:hypothetical protein